MVNGEFHVHYKRRFLVEDNTESARGVVGSNDVPRAHGTMLLLSTRASHVHGVGSGESGRSSGPESLKHNNEKCPTGVPLSPPGTCCQIVRV